MVEKVTFIEKPVVSKPPKPEIPEKVGVLSPPVYCPDNNSQTVVNFLLFGRLI